jgi:hypothetical protein
VASRQSGVAAGAVIDDEDVTISCEALTAASYRWAEKGLFPLAMWLNEMANAAELDRVPLRIDRKLAEELDLL